jgi:hypothetical protein
MAIDAAALVGGALGGAVVQSVLGPLVGQRHERRDLRGKVLHQLAAVENGRWAPRDGDEFRQAIVGLRTSALVAGLSRALIEFYVTVATAARMKSQQSWDEDPDPEYGGGIPIALSELTREAAETVASYAWHPYWHRFGQWRSMRRLNREKTRVAQELEKNPRARIDWEQVRPPA